MKTIFLAAICRATLLVAVLTISPAYSAEGPSAVFDFDTGTPTLKIDQDLPIAQASGGVTANFTGRFSIQSDASKHLSLSKFSGKYLYPIDTFKPPLEIHFSRKLTSITVTFATALVDKAEDPITIQLTAYVDSTASPAVGSATALGTKGDDPTPMGTSSFTSAHPLPMGTLSFTSAQPFNLVEITIPTGPSASFLVDNIQVVATAAVPTPRPSPRSRHRRAR